jgi:hypothetical protein
MKLFPPQFRSASRRFRRRFARATVAAGFVAVALPVAGSIAPALTASPAGPSCPWLNQSLPVSQRIGMLLPRMSLADKIDMVAGTGASSMMAGLVTSKPIRRLCVPAMGLQDGHRTALATGRPG